MVATALTRPTSAAMAPMVPPQLDAVVGVDGAWVRDRQPAGAIVPKDGAWYAIARLNAGDLADQAS